MASTHVQWDTYRRWKTGRAYSSPDIAPLIEEIAASPDWCLSETIRLQLSQTTEGGNLSMMSFEGNPFFSPNYTLSLSLTRSARSVEWNK